MKKKKDSTSAKFQENKLQIFILRLPSKIGADAGESLLGSSNKNSDITLTDPKH